MAVGFAAMTVAVIASTIVLAELLYPQDPSAAGPAPASWLAVNFASSLAAAVLGGWLAARLAPRAPFVHAVALAAVALVLSGLAAIRGAAPGQPAWYPAALAAVALAGILAGGRLYRPRPPREG